MSTTGRRTVGWQSPALLPTLIARRGPDREAYVAGGLRVWQLIGSPGFPPDLEELERRGHETYDRGVSRTGVMRQMMAVLTQPDRTAQLRRLSMPTLVIHGLADRMVHVSGGRSTAMAVPGQRAAPDRRDGPRLPEAALRDDRVRRYDGRQIGLPRSRSGHTA